jgi:hypothetical protein
MKKGKKIVVADNGLARVEAAMQVAKTTEAAERAARAKVTEAEVHEETTLKEKARAWDAFQKAAAEAQAAPKATTRAVLNWKRAIAKKDKALRAMLTTTNECLVNLPKSNGA